jgi:hypothetical protein
VIGGTGVNPAITTNAVISPDGTQNAETVVFNRGAGNDITNQSTLQQSITIPTTGPYIFSVYAKASTAGDVGKQIFLRIGNAGALTAITLTANWVRYSRAEVSVASGSQPVQIGNRGTVTLDNSVSVDLWGAQAEAGSVANYYVPTTTTSVTSSASGSIGATEGTIYAEVDIRNAFAGTFISLDIGSGADFLIIGRTSGLAVIVQLRRSNGFVVTIITSSAVALGVHKIALGYTNGDYALYIDGVSAGTSTNSTDYPSAALTRCGLAVTSYNIFNDRIRAAALYTTRLTNAQLATLTSL